MSIPNAFGIAIGRLYLKPTVPKDLFSKSSVMSTAVLVWQRCHFRCQFHLILIHVLQFWLLVRFCLLVPTPLIVVADFVWPDITYINVTVYLI